ncbi:hypothetical protein ACFOD0_02045 [Shewanella intestini]|uniref:DUF3486 family protein n=1 Tax=Shewanella intestini TaxID=2017544 RepID=A0ABS5I215_9GAMM|nr:MULTISPECIES: hypothetical protein [Shewanella]MBR9727863.1 hypothetical protein [Shewanella intestini]MRG36144.1 hypothetical protein [Shewanella sp. XMDDZSB0408]
MDKKIDLNDIIHAFDELNYENKTTGSLDQARNIKQMKEYLSGLGYSFKRMQVLQAAVDEMVTEMQEDMRKQELIQTFKTKVINLSRSYKISYQEVINIMWQLKK